MQLNYYFLKRLVPELEATLTGGILAACFSQEKDELILGFQKQYDFYIRATLTHRFSCLSFPEDFRRSRKNSANLFPQLVGQTVKALRLCENERAFFIEFERHSLLFKLHGNRSNIILFAEDGTRILFKNQLKGDLALDPSQLDRPIERSRSLYEKNPNFKDFYPTFGPIPASYLQSQGFERMEVKQQWQMLEDLVSEMAHNPFYHINFNGKPALSLLATSDCKTWGESAMEACNRFFRHFTGTYYFELKKKQTQSLLEKRIRQTASYIEKSEFRLEKLKKETQPGQVADILMANLHQIAPGLKKVTLLNFYTGAPIDIKLNAELSPQKNAEQYYRKSKNRKIEVEKTEVNILNKHEIQAQLKGLLSELETLKDIKSLRKWLKANDLDHERKQATAAALPYKAFDMAGYAVWVGKNASANDELTMKYAFKEDLWLHAKNVPGSHVLIKHKAGHKTPKEVIEKAAALAAWYSKRKTDSLVPVTVTPAKYVRKQKGSPPGQVIVSREEVVLVTPEKF